MNKQPNTGKLTLKPVQEQPKEKVKLPLTKVNFILMAIAGVMIILGFLLMTGSSSTPEEFNPDIFSTRRIVIGPTISFLGFVFMGYAIIHRKRNTENNNA